MLAAGVLVGLNLNRNYQKTLWGPIDAYGVHETYGWPIRCYQLIEWYEFGKISNCEERLLLLNIILNLLLLGAVAVLTEWFIRRRRRKSASSA